MGTANQESNISTRSAGGDTGLELSGLMVTTSWLSDHLPNPMLRLLDVRAAEHFAEGHLPGAVHVDMATLSTTVAHVSGMLLQPIPFAAKMNQFGIHPGATVIVYDDNWGLAAARVLWALQRYGFTKVALLTGGWDQWQAEGRSTTVATAEVVESGRFIPHANDSVLAERAWLLANLDNPDVVIIDTRSTLEFAGGHVPGAISWDWLNAVPVDSWDALRPAQELLAELTSIGITPDKEIVTYCRSGVRAAHTYWALRQLGYPRVRNYDGSWLEWQSVTGLPIGKVDK